MIAADLQQLLTVRAIKRDKRATEVQQLNLKREQQQRHLKEKRLELEEYIEWRIQEDQKEEQWITKQAKVTQEQWQAHQERCQQRFEQQGDLINAQRTLENDIKQTERLIEQAKSALNQAIMDYEKMQNLLDHAVTEEQKMADQKEENELEEHATIHFTRT